MSDLLIKISLRLLWRQACVYDKIPIITNGTENKFCTFSNKNPYAIKYNRAMMNLIRRGYNK